MAIQLQVSNSLEVLADKLCKNLTSLKQSVFQPVYIVTQTEGMNNWLKLQIANKIGIAANCLFLKPNDIINKTYYLLGGTTSETLSSENLSWLIFKLMGEDDFIRRYPLISAYYDKNNADSEVKRMALAEKVSDLFDQYQIYRTEMIEEWNSSPGNINIDGDSWQKELWVKAKEITAENFPDKTLVGKKIIEALEKKENKDRLEKNMPVIFLFGISVITEYHLKIFYHLAGYVNIHFLLLNPAPGIYWFDDISEKRLAFLKRTKKIESNVISSGNPLLTNWGKLIQDSFNLLFQSDSLLNTYEELQGEEPSQDTTLLHKIQYSIFRHENIDTGAFFSPEEIQDESIVINSCYSPVREVQVLYNYLVHLIDKKEEELSPRDIVVMVSDVDMYASYIKAIFDNATYRFPYTIADESYASSDSISNALNAVLSITEENFTAEEVIRLLDSSFIRSRFQITDPSLIRDVIDEANIRFGMEGKKEDDSVYISWVYGLKRIMYGICLSGSPEFGAGPESFYPIDMVEGHKAEEVIRFVHFAEQLMICINERKESRTIEGWVDYVDDILHNFICRRDETTEEDYLMILRQLEDYNSFKELFTEPVSYQVFTYSFLQKLATAANLNSFGVGGITFCSLIPMRSIPFKVVAMVGLNLDKFPRKENILSFNLMNEPKKGDRNIKENDKHLFLETILSAKDYLFISYIGQSVKDNSKIPPSSLVDELIDFIETKSRDPKNVREQLITRQPLHGFSQKYSTGNQNPSLYSYLGNNNAARKDLQKKEKSEPLILSEIFLDKLISFLQNPFKGYYNEVLSIYYDDEDVTLRDTELFEMDRLQQWKLKSDLLLVEEDREIDCLKDKLIKTGELPLKNMAEIAIQNVAEEVKVVRGLFKTLVGVQKEQVIPVDIKFGNYQLNGEIRGIYGDKLVMVSWSSNENKYLLGAYIRFLALRSMGKRISMHFISSKNGGKFDASDIDLNNPSDRLKEIIELYAKGHENIIAFDPYFKIEPTKVNELDEKKFEAALKKKFNNYDHPCTDMYMNREYYNGYFHSKTILEDYKEAAKILLVPLAKLFPTYSFK